MAGLHATLFCALRHLPRVPLDRFWSSPARLPEDAEIARVHHRPSSLDFWEQHGVQLLQVVPWNSRVDVVADVVVDVVPEEAVHLVADDGSGAQQLSFVPRRLVMLRDEADAIQPGEDVDRDQPEGQKLTEHTRTGGPDEQSSQRHDAQHQLESMNEPLLSIELLDGVDDREVDDRQDSTDQNVGVEEKKLERAPVPHGEGIGIFRGAVVAMMLQMILFERDEGDDERNHGKDAECPILPPRSEERRVGKECRSRWSPYHY